MSPETHLLASWIIAVKATDNPRDRRLVALAGLLPDADGLGLIVDAAASAMGVRGFELYHRYHHFLLHGALGAVLIAGALALFARQRGRVALLALFVFHLHLLCDLVGSRGPSPSDLWPIFYLGPFTRSLVWEWKGQWRLDGWQNQIINVALFAWALILATKHGTSFIGVFNRRVDEVFVRVLCKWRAGLARSRLVARVRRPPWRTVVPGVSLLLMAAGGYALWQPGLEVRDGRHDLKRNGIWLGHGWLGADDWFVRNGKTNQLDRFRSVPRVRELASSLKRHHIRYIFPHLCPCDGRGNLPAVDDAQAERFLAEFSGFHVLPWIGGPNGANVRYQDARWRAGFIASVTNLLAAHPGFAGVHLNVEPLPSGDRDFLRFLEELDAALRGNTLSVAAYPPPTRWHPFPELHWDEAYFREVSRRCDQLAVMMYDTSLRKPKLYEQLMADWTTEVLYWSAPKPVLLGVPTYQDADVGYHDPRVENLRHALLGIHAGLGEETPPPNYQGVAIYCEWETDEAEWNYFREHFLRR